ncbi:hypothetical protein K1719_047252 [Acacia pycnantha]|nr:hypothetical protein K1719_047252 [Acacia pycnantha]
MSMNQGSNSSSKNHSKAVHLKLCSPVNVQKGRTLVGRLETDKNLNKGIVISMIKKGWGLDKDMEIHGLPDHNAFLFRFQKQEDYNRVLKGRPWSIQGSGGKVVMFKLQRRGVICLCTFIRVRTLINILEPLTSGFWVPRPQRESIWVVVKYERLQNYCYDCGKIGHEARNCKVPNNDSEEDDSERSVGNGLGTPHVRTIEDALVVHDQKWDETALLRRLGCHCGLSRHGSRRKRDHRYGNSLIHGAHLTPSIY